jgi:hypothetical protein
MRKPVVCLAALLLVRSAAADEVLLKSGGRLSGRIVTRTATTIEVDVGAGRIAVPVASVVSIEEGRSALQAYEERAASIPAGDVDGWVALADWASDKGLGSQAREAYQRALSASPNDPRANTALGNVQVDGRWMSEEDGYRARGYVRFEREWMTPAEQDAILRERAADAEQERRRQESEVRVREAEAQAQEAEARARKAEADAKAAEAQASSSSVPSWYGWGAGPTTWPVGPIVMQPIAPYAGPR